MWIWISMVFAACSLGVAGWWLGRPYAQAGQILRKGFPWHLSLLWPWIEALALLCRPFMSWRWRARLQDLLHQAGAEAYWTPHHLCALQGVVALLSAAFMGGMLYGVTSRGTTVLCALLVAGVAAFWPGQRLRERIRRRKQLMLREFPFMLDMITLCVEAGLNLHGAMQQAAHHGPEGPLKEELLHVLADIRAGSSRQHALANWAQRCNLAPLHHFVSAVAQAEHSGVSLGAVLRAQADQRRNERFQQAERLALEAPVKMMFPLVFCIFPCSFLIIAFPIAVQFLDLWSS